MPESGLHRRLKRGASAELRKDGYNVVHEPRIPPLPGVSWGSYRPDIFAHRDSAGGTEVVLVECETSPSTRKLRKKSAMNVQLQTHILSRDTIRHILVIPRGTLKSLDMSIRTRWEVWIVENMVTRIPSTEDNQESAAPRGEFIWPSVQNS